MGKKTLKFTVDEDHTDFEKVRVNPTKTFDIDDLGIVDPHGYSLLSKQDLEFKLDHEDLTEDQIEIIKEILKTK